MSDAASACRAIHVNLPRVLPHQCVLLVTTIKGLHAWELVLTFPGKCHQLLTHKATIFRRYFQPTCTPLSVRSSICSFYPTPFSQLSASFLFASSPTLGFSIKPRFSFISSRSLLTSLSLAACSPSILLIFSATSRSICLSSSARSSKVFFSLSDCLFFFSFAFLILSSSSLASLYICFLVDPS